MLATRFLNMLAGCFKSFIHSRRHVSDAVNVAARYPMYW